MKRSGEERVGGRVTQRRGSNHANVKLLDKEKSRKRKKKYNVTIKLRKVRKNNRENVSYSTKS